MWPSRRIRGLIWLVYTVSWSTALLVPMPPAPIEALRDPEVEFTVAKGLHVLAYALLTLLTLSLRLDGAWRWVLLAFPFAHGVATESLQWYFAALGRHGCIEDVIRDWVGVALGLALWFGWPLSGRLRGTSQAEAVVASADGSTLVTRQSLIDGSRRTVPRSGTMTTGWEACPTSDPSIDG
jgi:VanZ family protein